MAARKPATSLAILAWLASRSIRAFCTSNWGDDTFASRRIVARMPVIQREQSSLFSGGHLKAGDIARLPGTLDVFLYAILGGLELSRRHDLLPTESKLTACTMLHGCRHGLACIEYGFIEAILRDRLEEASREHRCRNAHQRSVLSKLVDGLVREGNTKFCFLVRDCFSRRIRSICDRVTIDRGVGRGGPDIISPSIRLCIPLTLEAYLEL